MDTTNKNQILENIEKVYEKANHCKLETAFFESIQPELKLLSNYFNLTERQCFFIAVVFAFYYDKGIINLKTMKDYFKCKPFEILEFINDIEHLKKIGILKITTKLKSNTFPGFNDFFILHEQFTEAILKNQPIPIINSQEFKNIIELLEYLYNLYDLRHDEEISIHQFLDEVNKLILENTHFPLIKKLKQFDFEIETNCIYLYSIWNTLSGNETTKLNLVLDCIYSRPSKRVMEIQKLINGEHILVINGLVEITKSFFSISSELKLTDTSLNLLNDCGINLFLNKKKRDNIITPADIAYHELIFDFEEMNQIDTLQNLLQEEKFQETQTRLTNKSLPKGINILLHGEPGTGKTEIVKQLAKATDREIMKVEISQSKSMWFGESEKKIKSIFTEYRVFAKDCHRTPILLFNEADANLSRRKINADSNTSQTENAIQNILLEELENFEGILMATTNLANNLDSAFERRFLFKIPFNKPKPEIRAKIWKLKLPHLDIEHCQILAENFDFSGGQIDNIIRKIEIQEIIHGTNPNIEQIQRFCLEESMTPNQIKIGFDYAQN